MEELVESVELDQMDQMGTVPGMDPTAVEVVVEEETEEVTAEETEAVGGMEEVMDKAAEVVVDV